VPWPLPGNSTLPDNNFVTMTLLEIGDWPISGLPIFPSGCFVVGARACSNKPPAERRPGCPPAGGGRFDPQHSPGNLALVHGGANCPPHRTPRAVMAGLLTGRP